MKFASRRGVGLILMTMLAAVLASGVLALSAASSSEAAFPGKNGKIAFVSNRDAGGGEIYAMKPDGTGVARITFPNGGASDPAFSPDGTEIAFAKGGDIYVMDANGMNPDGTGARRLTNTPIVESDPAFSPDGKIAFVANSFDVDRQTDLEIWSMNADGTGRTQLTNNTFPDTQPAWSPLGDEIAFVSARTGETDNNVYVMNADGGGQTNLTPNSPTGCSSNCYQGHDDDPTWSPDGSKIAYVHGYGPPENPFAGGGEPNIWTMDPNGTGKTNISDNSSVSAVHPAYSPDGTRIVYVGATNTNRDIWIMNANGTSQDILHADAANDIKPGWQQDSIPPNTTVTSGPSGTTGSTSASFAFVSSETDSTFECSLDGAPFSPCSSPQSYPGLANGLHTFRVQATDVAGNADATPAERTWTIDPNVAPTVKNDSYVVKEDKKLTVRPPGVLRNDSDSDGDPLSARLLKRTKNGKLTLKANGSFVYKPKRNFNGTDSFTYRASDGKLSSKAAQVKIRVRVVRN